MKAWVVRRLGQPEEMSFEDFDEGRRPEGLVRINVRATGVNFFEGLLVEGRYQVRPELPFIPGTEGSGVVESAPRGSAVAPGDRVAFLAPIGRGSYAEVVDAEPASVVPIPPSMSNEQGASLLATYLTAHLALHSRAHLREGETVLVHAAAGGVGTAAVQLAKAAGARVIATAGSAGKLEFCRQQGADLVLNYRRDDFPRAVREATGGRGADIVIDPVGGETFKASSHCVAFGGRLVPVGFTSGEIGEAAVNHVLLKSYSIVGVHLNLHLKLAPDDIRAALEHLFRLFAEGRISPPISATYPITDAPLALRAVISGATTGKVVLLAGVGA